MKPPTDLAGYNPASDDYRWDGEAAERAVNFFSKFCKHIKGSLANKPYDLNPWEHDVVATLFGWKREDGTRRYREAFIGIPRKNSKTTLCAGLALYMLFADGEEGAEVYCAAGTRDQASKLFQPAAAMVRGCKALARRANVLDSTKRIVVPATNSYMVAVPAEAGPLHGSNAHCVIIDEVHTQPSRHLYDVFKTCFGARAQPLLVGITTAGHDRESICYELWDYSQKVRAGEIQDDSFLPVIYEATAKDDWKDREVWKRVNPNYGRSIQSSFLESEFSRALALPSYENTFKNLYLNIWTESETRWLTTEAWDSCRGDMPDMTGQSCYAGLDLASTDDITAYVKVFPVNGQHVANPHLSSANLLYVVPHFFLPEETVRLARKKFQKQYASWRDLGLLTVTQGNATDYGAVRAQILEDAQRYNLKMLGFDAWQALDTYQQLDMAGIPCIKIPQTFSGLHLGVKSVEEAVLAQTLVHDGNPVLRWMLGCTVIEQDGQGNRKPSKRKSQGDNGQKGKIDGIAAMVMAFTQITSVEQEAWVSVLS